MSEGLLDVAGRLVEAWLGAEVGVTSLSVVPSYDGTSTLTILTFRDVNLSGGVVGSRPADSVEVSVVGPVLDFDLAPNVGLVRFLVAVAGAVLDFLRDALGTLLRKTVLFLVDVDLLALCRAADSVFFVDADLFLVSVVATVGRNGGREGFVALFVTFPSDDRSLRR